MHISDFRYHRPATLDEAVQLLNDSTDGVLLAGGTDLLVDLKQGKRSHQDVISLTRLPELESIDVVGNSLVIGAMVTHNQLVHSATIREHCNAISEAAESIATEQIRNAATVGGNLCTAASCADTAPILIALGAAVEIVNKQGSRTLPLSEFFVDHRTTALARGDVLSAIVVPLPPPGVGAAYEKFGLRQAANISVASVAVTVHVQEERVAAARFVMGAVAPTPKISPRAYSLVKGQTVADLLSSRALTEEVGAAVAADAEPIDDLRGTAQFRREIVAVLARRSLAKALSRAMGSGGVMP
ncbi:MAG: xanthine dehydrogenase family protein subunit M [Gemmatimonadota bacterium]|nr:MAG: xanthine dehydrogenase family protein subunit M [Gemmatimonadota bacterium]